jgi:5-oxoprolinase (ATP-hydrolysing)
VVGSTGDTIEVLVEPDMEKVRTQLQQLLDGGVRSMAIVFLHSYAFAEHERRVARLALEMGFEHISTSSETVGSIRIVERGLTTAVDAYLTPLVKEYIRNFKRGFDADLANVALSFMMSDGGLCHVDVFNGYRSILSGPAGGVVGYAKTCYDAHEQRPLIGFDMGGTSTDVSHYDGEYHHIFETQISGVAVLAPQLDITTVAAGGGSRLFFRAGLFIVGYCLR